MSKDVFIEICKVQRMKKLTDADHKFDSIDRALITALHQNSRASLRALSRQIGLSAPGCTERLKRLEAAGVISGFSLELDAEALGFPLQSMVRVKPFPGRLHEVERLLKNIPENIACFKVTGEDGFVCHLYLRSVSHLDEVLQKITRLADTNTSIIKAVERKLPPL